MLSKFSLYKKVNAKEWVICGSLVSCLCNLKLVILNHRKPVLFIFKKLFYFTFFFVPSNQVLRLKDFEAQTNLQLSFACYLWYRQVKILLLCPS